MSAESQQLDPIPAAIARLEAERDKINQAIQTLRALAPLSPGEAASQPTQDASPVPAEGPGAFLGMSIPEAARKLLATRRKALNNAEIIAAFTAGGLQLSSANPLNTVNSVLTRRFKQVGDIVRVSRGMWGLKEWYPGRNFRKDKGENGDSKSETSEPEQPSKPKPAAAKPSAS